MASGKVRTGREWVSFPREDYLKAIDTMVHQSFKSVNSTCTAGGVLVGNDQGISQPYVSVRTLLAAGQPVLLDRTAPARKSIITNQIQRVEQGSAIGASQEEIKVIQTALERTRNRGKVLCDEISPRLRQILLPRDDGSYLSVSPISVSGISHRLRSLMIQNARAIDEMLEQNNPTAESRRKIETCEISIGGSNFQNAIGLVDIRKAICIVPPVDNASPNDLLSLHRNGVFLAIPKPLSVEYRLWRKALKGTVALSRNDDSNRQQLTKRVAKHLLRLGADAFEVLERNKHRLPEQRLLNPALPISRRALIDKSLRDDDWPLEFSKLVVQVIVEIDSDHTASTPYSLDEMQILSSIVQRLFE